MGRWEPGAESRLREAALQLYLRDGFEQTTVADIAERAGVTSRTFFRYFTDKREVIFGGAAELERRVTHALEAAPAEASVFEAVAAAIEAAGEMIGGNRNFARQRQEVIAATPELQERELMKMAGLAAALAAGLQRRGVAPGEAKLAAETGIAVFKVAFEQWLLSANDPGLVGVMRESFDQLRALTA